jgi:hypothetical protein
MHFRRAVDPAAKLITENTSGTVMGCVGFNPSYQLLVPGSRLVTRFSV